jgi:hypothetical protein
MKKAREAQRPGCLATSPFFLDVDVMSSHVMSLMIVLAA